MPDRLTLAQAVDVVIGYAVAGDERYQRAAGRLLGRIGLERGLTMGQTRTLMGCFDYCRATPTRPAPCC